MRLKDKSFSVKFFPFAPKVPWKLNYGLYVVPEINYETWQTIISPAETISVVTDHTSCGLIEAYFSLSYLEFINKANLGKKLLWAGNDKFNKLLWMNGLAKPSDKSFTKELLKKYPTPIFLDKKHNIYFNFLNNYIDVYNYCGNFAYVDNKPLLRQMWRNLAIAGVMDDMFIPQLRSFRISAGVEKWVKENNFYINKPYVCIFPDLNSGFSVHGGRMLNWNVQQVRAFSAMLRQAGYSTIIFTNNVRFFTGENVAPMDLDFILYFLLKSKAVLSEEVDFLLLSMMLSNAKVIALKKKDHTDILQNAQFLNRSNVIDRTKGLTPAMAFNNLGGNG